MERITKSMVVRAFELLTKQLGKRIATSYNDVGAWRLDYYNGYNIEEIMTTGGGITQPLGSDRKNAREMFECCHFAMRVLDVKEAK